MEIRLLILVMLIAPFIPIAVLSLIDTALRRGRALVKSRG